METKEDSCDAPGLKVNEEGRFYRWARHSYNPADVPMACHVGHTHNSVDGTLPWVPLMTGVLSESVDSDSDIPQLVDGWSSVSDYDESDDFDGCLRESKESS